MFHDRVLEIQPTKSQNPIQSAQICGVKDAKSMLVFLNFAERFSRSAQRALFRVARRRWKENKDI